MAMAMAVADGTVYTGSALGSQSASGEVVALDGATGGRRWSAGVGAPVAALVVTAGVVAKLAASGDVLYAAVNTLNSGYALYALRV
jgi:outer membrane protein assembly factor BamB